MTLRPDEKNEGWVVAQWELACDMKITMCDDCMNKRRLNNVWQSRH